MPGFTQIPNDWVFDDPLWTSEKFTKGMALIDLYRLKQYHPGVIQKRGIIIKLEPGQIGWSQAELTKRWKRSIGWVRRLLKYLKKAGHIELQKTNVSTTITLLHWINNDTANKHANGKQTVSQTESKRYPNNIVNTINKDYKGKGNHQPRFNLNLEELKEKYPDHDWNTIRRRYLNHCEDINREPSNGGWKNWYEEDIDKGRHMISPDDDDYTYPWDEKD